MTRRRSLPLALLALTLGAGCSSGTETGNPEEPTRLAFGARPGSAPSGVTLEEARLSLPSVLLTTCDAGESPLLGPQALDLVGSGEKRAPFDHPLREACGATVELGPSALAEPAVLSGLTALFRGTREDGARFEIRSAYAQHLALVTAPPGTELDAARLFLAVDLGIWIDAAGLPALVPVNGVVTVDSTHDAAALTAFESATVHALSLHLDADGNGRLEGAELSPVAVPE